MSEYSSHPSTTVAILCGDPVVGRVIGNLLRAVGYEARLLEEVPPNGVSGFALLLIAPGAGFEMEKSLFEDAGLPVLDLDNGPLAWPCRIEEITAAIENALRDITENALPNISLPDDLPLSLGKTENDPPAI